MLIGKKAWKRGGFKAWIIGSSKVIENNSLPAFKPPGFPAYEREIL
jgi:hypothetical protein